MQQEPGLSRQRTISCKAMWETLLMIVKKICVGLKLALTRLSASWLGGYLCKHNHHSSNNQSHTRHKNQPRSVWTARFDWPAAGLMWKAMFLLIFQYMWGESNKSTIQFGNSWLHPIQNEWEVRALHVWNAAKNNRRNMLWWRRFLLI